MPLAIPVIDSPTDHEFRHLTAGHARPFVVRGRLGDWSPPSIDGDAVRDRCGHLSLGMWKSAPTARDGVMVPGLWTGPEGGRPHVEMNVARFIDELWPRPATNLYFRQPPHKLIGLGGDLRAPPVIEQARAHRSVFWMGSAGLVSQLHYDPWHNVQVVLHGRKRFALFEPRDRSNVYPWALLSGQYPFLSRIPDIDDCDLLRFPRFRDAVRHEVVVGSGETIFMPAGWWHSVWTEQPSVAVNHWYGRNRLPAAERVRLALFNRAILPVGRRVVTAYRSLRSVARRREPRARNP